MSLIDELITNRTRGATYDFRDLNRVENALDYLHKLLQNAGNSVIIKLHGEWKNGDNFTEADARNYLDSILAIKSTLALPETTPSVPDDMNDLTSIEANNIEKILIVVNRIIQNMISAYFYSNELYSGELEE